MNRKIKRLAAFALALTVLLLGCGKKGITVTPDLGAEASQPQPPPPENTVVHEEVRTFGEPDNFLEVDVDAAIKAAFETIYFSYDQFTLSPEAMASLEKAANMMREQPNLRVMAEGHADERGTSSYNVGLGESRAQAVRGFLDSYGVNSARIELTSYGKERPANPNCDGEETCHSRNRRVEWRIIGK